MTLWRSSETTLNPETDLAATGRATDKYQSSSDDAERSAESKRLTRCGLTAYPGANQNYKDMARNPQREILAYLLAGGRLTVQKAIQMFDTTELRRIVSRLKDRGFPVVADKQYGETKTGRRVRFNEYRMGQDLGSLQ